ncbi:TonB-dependent receptor domain-containing protein [Phenylobacterium sp. J367]|uniref:TonB-dependent receptor domain-containing protein n=1 Tax=Phenylobacterium sp. J367 TaxID=2898435 RepID=UPI002150FF4E|nr:TonB-dependent receptor [Phenylobacterium sp. J367]MCR5877845.1 TonB-dependent receptor [Phenylobacterium sp. J367]
MASVAALAAAWQAQAADAAAEVQELVITAARLDETLPQELAAYGADLETIRVETVRDNVYVDVSQALQMQTPGLFVSPRNGPFSYVDLSLQGSRTGDVLWLVDGVRINNRLYTSTSPADTLPASMVERVEVLKGGQGLFYGTQAAAGVINVVTRAYSDDLQAEATVGGDTNDGIHADVMVRDTVGPHRFVAWASKDESDGYETFDVFQPSATARTRGYDVVSFGGKYGVDLADGLGLNLYYQHTDAHLDYPGARLTKLSFNERDEEIASASLDWTAREDVQLSAKGYYHDWDSVYSTVNNVPGQPGRTVIVDDLTYWGYEDYGFSLLAKLNLHRGFEYQLAYDFQKFNGRDDVLLIGEQTEKVHAFVAQVRTTDELFERARFAAGVRHNRTDDTDATVWNLSGHVDLTDSLYVEGTAGTSFLLPSAEQLFAIDPCCAAGNPDLEPEESLNLNAALGQQTERFRWQATAFWRRVQDLIVDDYDQPAFPDGVYLNTDGEVRVRGVELQGQVEIAAGLTAQASWSWTRSREKGSDVQLDRIPEHQAKGAVVYDGERWGRVGDAALGRRRGPGGLGLRPAGLRELRRRRPGGPRLCGPGPASPDDRQARERLRRGLCDPAEFRPDRPLHAAVHVPVPRRAPHPCTWPTPIPTDVSTSARRGWAPKWLVATHRYLGVVMGLLMLIWFLSGIVMLFARWPTATEAERTAGLAPIPWERCCDLGPGGRDATVVGRASLEAVGDRPVLRLDGEVLDLTTGAPARFSEADARAAARAFTGGEPGEVRTVERDQWTVVGYFNRERPFWRVETPGGNWTYVSQVSGRVVSANTAGERFWAWLGAIPHWLYPQVLRQDGKLWSQVVIWTSMAGLFLTLTGIYLGVLAWRRAPAGRISPFRGVLDWHHIASLFTGVLTLTWVLSGLLSMQPWGLLESGPSDAAERVAGGEATYGELRAALEALKAQRPAASQVKLVVFDGRLSLIADGRRYDAAGRPAPLTSADLIRAGERLGAARQGLIAEGDAYHYRHHEDAVLPAWRVIRADGVRHYLNPTTGELLRTADGPAKGFRWGHLFLHRFDIVPVSAGWAAVMTVLLAACTAGVATGVWLGVRRIGHDLAGLRRRLPGPRIGRRLIGVRRRFPSERRAAWTAPPTTRTTRRSSPTNRPTRDSTCCSDGRWC